MQLIYPIRRTYLSPSFIKYSILLILLFASSVLSAQFSIKGKITDNNNIPIPFASIAQFSLPDSAYANGTMATDDGDYKLENLKAGSYYLEATFYGYKSTKSPQFTLSQEKPTFTSDLKMAEDVVEIEGIVLKAQKPVVRQEAGKTILDVQSSPLNAGMSAADVLKRVPGVTVDKDGKVSLKGREGVQLNIDGKPVYLSADQIGNLLQSIPADQLSEIEAVSSPSASQDAAGNAGVINLKLKKGLQEGFNGSVNGSIGHGVYPRGNAGINLSYKKKKLTTGAGYQYNYRKGMDRGFIERTYSSFGDSAYNTYRANYSPAKIHSLLFNGSFELNNKNSFGWNASGFYEDFTWEGDNTSYIYNPQGNLVTRMVSDENSIGKESSVNATINYKHRFDTVGTELKTSANLVNSPSHSKQRFITTYYNNEGSSIQDPYNYNSNIPVDVNQWSAQTDFKHKLTDSLQLEAGLKHLSIHTNSNATSSIVPENNFTYSENIEAAYVMLNGDLRKWKYSGGLRLEHTGNIGEQKSMDTTFKRNYTNLFPSAMLSYQGSEKTSYTIMYSRRINRPDYEDLNPFLYYSDPYSAFSGNPYLIPEYTHRTEFTFSNWYNTFLATVDYSYTKNPLSNIWIIDPENLTTSHTYSNLVSQQNVGLSLTFNKSITGWWTSSNNFYGYHSRLKGDVGYGMENLSRVSWVVNTTQTFKLAYGITAEISGMYEAPHYYGTVLYREVWELNAGLQKKLFNDKLSLKLSASDIFWKHIYVGEGTFGDTHTRDSFKWDNRRVMFSLSYRFGKDLFYEGNETNIPTGNDRR